MNQRTRSATEGRPVVPTATEWAPPGDVAPGEQHPLDLRDGLTDPTSALAPTREAPAS